MAENEAKRNPKFCVSGQLTKSVCLCVCVCCVVCAVCVVQCVQCRVFVCVVQRNESKVFILNLAWNG